MARDKKTTIEELDKLAMSFIKGEIEPKVIESLCPIDRVTALSLISAYSICINGLMSREACKQVKLKIISSHALISSQIVWMKAIYSKHIEYVKRTSTLFSDMLLKIKSGDGIGAVAAACKIADAECDNDVYTEAFRKACSDENFKEQALREGAKQVDRLQEEYGNDIPYAKMIERFYAAASGDGLMEAFKYFDEDNYRPLAEDLSVIDEISNSEMRAKVNRIFYNLYGAKAS